MLIVLRVIDIGFIDSAVLLSILLAIDSNRYLSILILPNFLINSIIGIKYN